jgi:hypothetical protein
METVMKAHSALSIIPGMSEWKVPTRWTLMAAAAALALTASGASAGGQQPAASFSGVISYPLAQPCAHVGGCIWDQNSAGGGGAGGVDSQNFTSTIYAAYDDAGADDFSVTSTTLVHGIDVSGVYFNGSGPATSANVTFYNDTVIGGVHQPGAVVASYPNQATNESVNGLGNFQIDLQVCKTNAKGKTKCKDKPVRFKGGRKKTPVTYWVSVVANCSFVGGCGEWGWDTRTVFGTTNPAVWENPPGPGFPPGCLTWSNLNNACIGFPADDFMFDLF